MFHVDATEIVVALLFAVAGIYRAVTAARSRREAGVVGTAARIPPRPRRVPATAAPRVPSPQPASAPAPQPRPLPAVRPPSSRVGETPSVRLDVRSAVQSQQRLRDAIVLAEILSPPLALRERT